MIQRAEIFDLPLLVEGAKLFFGEGKLPGVFDPNTFLDGWARLITSGVGVIFIAWESDTVKGAIGGAMSPDINTGDITAAEMFWFMKPDHRRGLDGIRLLKAFEDWSRQNGAIRIWMLHVVGLNDNRFESLYPRLGYSLAERIYIKDL